MWGGKTGCRVCLIDHGQNRKTMTWFVATWFGYSNHTVTLSNKLACGVIWPLPSGDTFWSDPSLSPSDFLISLFLSRICFLSAATFFSFFVSFFFCLKLNKVCCHCRRVYVPLMNLQLIKTIIMYSWSGENWGLCKIFQWHIAYWLCWPRPRSNNLSLRIPVN